VTQKRGEKLQKTLGEIRAGGEWRRTKKKENYEKNPVHAVKNRRQGGKKSHRPTVGLNESIPRKMGGEESAIFRRKKKGKKTNRQTLSKDPFWGERKPALGNRGKKQTKAAHTSQKGKKRRKKRRRLQKPSSPRFKKRGVEVQETPENRSV